MAPKRFKRSDSEPARRRRSPEEEAKTPVSGSQFRRNRTLSSYRHNTIEESSRLKAHNLVTQRRKLSGIFSIVVVATALLALLLWQLMAQVNVNTSTKQLSTQFSGVQYEEAINQYLGINPAQRLRFSLNEEALSAYVSQIYPEVDSLKLGGAPGLAQGNFAITFRTPVAGWHIDGKQHYVDANGVVFDKSYYEEPTVQIIDESGIDPEQGSAVVGGRLLGFLGRIVSQAESRGYSVERAVLPNGMTREVDIYLEGISTRVKLSIDRGAGEQTEDMARSLEYLRSRKVSPEYIDVRVDGRAAYR